ncbi:helix-turn-helix domain-containing protein [Dongia sp.]|uniref:AlbA family DNA-binding domain-containing protein n=1 Tax=Dongia sp. TaxID=1977262 RepID=UPI0035B33726
MASEDIEGFPEYLLGRFSKEGVELIDNLISEEASESLFLEFKRLSTSDSAKLHENDRKYLREALSGFANAEGGVIVWGVDCALDPVSGADVATKKIPIPRAQHFRSALEAATPGMVIPPVHGVRHVVATEGDGQSGYVVTYIPKSEGGPHQTVKENRYLIRLNSTFQNVPHQILAGMFGKRPNPNVIHKWMASVPEIFDNGTAIRFALTLMLQNVGRGIAESAFATATLEYDGGRGVAGSMHLNDNSNWSIGGNMGNVLSSVALPHLKIAPMGMVAFCTIEIEAKSPVTTSVVIGGVCGSQGSISTPIENQFLPQTLNHLIKTLSTRNPMLNREELRSIVEDIILLQPSDSGAGK